MSIPNLIGIFIVAWMATFDYLLKTSPKEDGKITVIVVFIITTIFAIGITLIFI